VCDFLNQNYPEIVSKKTKKFEKEQFFGTAGNSHALSVVCTLLIQGKQSTVLCDNPTYPFAMLTIENHRTNLIGVPQQGGQTDVDQVRREVEQAKAENRPVAFIYVIPSYHNPTGASMTAENRQKLVDLAHELDFYIVADDVYQLLTFDGNVPMALSCFEAETEPEQCRVLSLGTFSKIFAPAMRVGWLQTRNTAFMKRMYGYGEHISGGGFSAMSARVCERMLVSGRQQELLAVIKTRLDQKCTFMCDKLKQYCEEISFTVPTGGYFIWIELQSGVKANAMDILKACRAEKVDYFNGGVFRTGEVKEDRWIRLSFAYMNEEEIEAGIKIMGQIIKRFII
jgi:DNA-binding transcriptional MocR family regulator